MVNMSNISGVGKTCITRQFLYHEFKSNELTTIGNMLYIILVQN